MSAPMVLANLAGTKTQTRRPLYVKRKFSPNLCIDQRYPPSYGNGEWPNVAPGECWALSNWHKAKPGDRIWQRETWKRGCGHTDDDTVCVAYAASQEPGTGGLLVNNIPRPAAVDLATWEEDEKWRPSIHMPRWVCRFTALITAVRIQRLQDISEADAIAEGLGRVRGPLGSTMWEYSAVEGGQFADPRVAYHMLWDSINGPAGWTANPWVWVVTYERIKP